MKYQTTPYNCGPAALQNAMKVLKHNVSQQKIAELAGTTESEGTDEHGIIRAAVALGHGVDEVNERDASKAFGRVYGALLCGRPVVLCVDRWSHWVTLAGVCGTSIILVEPGGYAYSTRENGIGIYNKDRLLRRWRAARRVAGRGPRYFGLAIGGTNV